MSYVIIDNGVITLAPSAEDENTQDPDVLICRGCMATDTALFRLDKNMSVTFNEITGNLARDQKFPDFLCAYCLHLTKKISKFIERCNNSADIMTKMLRWNNLNTEAVNLLDRTGLGVDLTICNTETVSCDPPVYKSLGTTGMLHIDFPPNLDSRPSVNMEYLPSHIDNDPKTSDPRDEEVITNLNDINKPTEDNFNKTCKETTKDSPTVFQNVDENRIKTYTIVNTKQNETENPSHAVDTIDNHKKLTYSSLIIDDDSVNKADNVLQKPSGYAMDDAPDLNQDEEMSEVIDTKDDLIIKEENLIHPVDDDLTVTTNDEKSSQKKVDVNNSDLKVNIKEQETVKTVDIESNSSSSSSSSILSGSSDTDDDIEISMITPAEIDLTADDEENKMADKDNNLKENVSSNINAISQPAQKSLVQETNPNSNQNTTEDNVLDKNKDTEVINVDETQEDPNVENSEVQNVVEAAAEVKATGKDGVDNLHLKHHASNKGDNSGSKGVIFEVSDSEDDLPDCLFGLNSDIYKKDKVVPFAKRKKVVSVPVNTKPDVNKKIGNLEKVTKEFVAKKSKETLVARQSRPDLNHKSLLQRRKDRYFNPLLHELKRRHNKKYFS